MDAPISLEAVQAMYAAPTHMQQSAEVPKGADVPAIVQRNDAQKARQRALADAGISIGVRTGLAWQLRNVDAAVQATARDLDFIYDFGPLMIQNSVVPAVITEARDLYNQDGDLAVRRSGVFFQIERQARFSSTPPNWREYLTFPKVSVDASTLRSFLAPATDEERELWRVAVADGWKQGVEQANIMLAQAMDRLNRDFVGITRFHRLVIQGRLSMPAVATESIPVTKTAGSLVIDEKLLRITTLPDFNSRVEKWQPVVITSQTEQPKE
jgi:defect in organelle trafficking protein DotC